MEGMEGRKTEMSNFKLTSHKAEVLSAVKDKKARALEIIGGKAESYAKKLCPVRTGRLRNSITHQQRDDDTEVIGSNVEYAPHVCLGTRRSRKKPFLRPAVENHTEEYKAILKRVMSDDQ